MKVSSKSDMGIMYPLTDLVLITPKADVFSLGVTLFRLLMGDKPVLMKPYH